jgi:hypothetical protein
MLLVALLILSVLWLLIAGVVIAACRMAARADAQLVASALAQSPRRASTCGTVRSRILTSFHSDQLATYR